MRHGKTILRAALCLLTAGFLAIAAFSARQLWRLQEDVHREQEFTQQLRAPQEAVQTESVPASEAPVQPLTPQEKTHSCPVEWQTLQEKYPDAAAWLSGAGIDTPVAQGEDNTFYLDHLLDGTKNRLGTAFLDSRNSAHFTDDQSFIFGHHMDTDDGVFSPLLRYREPGYYEKHPSLTLHTPHGCFTAEIFAAFIVEQTEYPFVRSFAGEKDKKEFLTGLLMQSELKTGVAVSAQDRILTLSTCTSKTNDLRYVVCTRLVPEPSAENPGE